MFDSYEGEMHQRVDGAMQLLDARVNDLERLYAR
jgi:hypothetical protein